MQYKKGYEEDSFLKMLNLPAREMEFMAGNCTKVSNNYRTHCNNSRTQLVPALL